MTSTTPNPDPSIEELTLYDRAMRDLLATFFDETGIHESVAAILLANVLGEMIHAYSAPEDLEHSLASVFKIIRIRAEGHTGITTMPRGDDAA